MTCWRRLGEPLDDTADILVAYDGDRLAGTARINLGTKCDLAATDALSEPATYARLFRMAEFAPYFPRRVSIRTKLMVRLRARP